MCISKNIIVAIYGQSGTGKTTTAKLASKLLGLKLRICGDVVRDKAASLNISPKDLSILDHKDIDAETIKWIERQRSTSLVEGRFLNFVLDDCSSPVYVVHIKASDEARSARLGQRSGSTYLISDVHEVDAVDCDFCQKMYNGKKARTPDLTIDATNLTPSECAEWLTQSLKNEKP